MKNLRGLFAALMKSPAVPIATAVMTVAFMAAAGLAFLPLAHAAPADKVWVCKYVGTPGVNERLQPSVQNPISVSANSLKVKGFIGELPFAFADKQGKSLAVEWDTGGPAPKCTATETKTEPPTTAPPKTEPPKTATTEPPTAVAATTSVSSRGVAAHAGGDDDSSAIIAIGAIVLALGLGGARLLQRRRQSA